MHAGELSAFDAEQADDGTLVARVAPEMCAETALESVAEGTTGEEETRPVSFRSCGATFASAKEYGTHRRDPRCGQPEGAEKVVVWNRQGIKATGMTEEQGRRAVRAIARGWNPQARRTAAAAVRASYRDARRVAAETVASIRADRPARRDGRTTRRRGTRRRVRLAAAASSRGSPPRPRPSDARIAARRRS